MTVQYHAAAVVRTVVVLHCGCLLEKKWGTHLRLSSRASLVGRFMTSYAPIQITESPATIQMTVIKLIRSNEEKAGVHDNAEMAQ